MILIFITRSYVSVTDINGAHFFLCMSISVSVNFNVNTTPKRALLLNAAKNNSIFKLNG